MNTSAKKSEVIVFILATFTGLFGIVIGWAVLLYFYYDQQTFLFLIKAPKETLWQYSRNIFFTKQARPPRPTPEPVLSRGTTSASQPSQSPVPTDHTIKTMSHMYQKLNNCGPSSVAMAASTLGANFDQFLAAAVLKGSDKDKNVSPTELVPFLKTQGLDGVYRVNGSIDQIEALVAQNILVIVEQWLVKRGTGELVGHYRVVRGYDSAKQLFITNDSFNGPNFTIPYNQFDDWWRPFNRTYIPVFKPSDQTLVEQVLGEDWDETTNWQKAYQTNTTEVTTYQDGYAYFNLGSSQVGLKQYAAAAEAFDKALEFSFPEHFLWYQFAPLEAYVEVEKYQEVLNLAQNLIDHAGEVEEARFYRGLVFFKQGEKEKAKVEFQKAIEANPRYQKAQDFLFTNY